MFPGSLDVQQTTYDQTLSGQDLDCTTLLVCIAVHDIQAQKAVYRPMPSRGSLQVYVHLPACIRAQHPVAVLKAVLICRQHVHPSEHWRIQALTMAMQGSQTKGLVCLQPKTPPPPPATATSVNAAVVAPSSPTPIILVSHVGQGPSGTPVPNVASAPVALPPVPLLPTAGLPVVYTLPSSAPYTAPAAAPPQAGERISRSAKVLHVWQPG